MSNTDESPGPLQRVLRALAAQALGRGLGAATNGALQRLSPADEAALLDTLRAVSSYVHDLQRKLAEHEQVERDILAITSRHAPQVTSALASVEALESRLVAALRSTEVEALRRNALSKLTKAERLALGIVDP